MSVQIPILYGTETGNAEECAEELAQAIAELGWTSEAIDLDDFESNDICDLPLVFIVSSTHGNGDPPENAEELMDYLQEEDVVLNNVHYAVCGLGDRAYPYFAQCGKDFDKHMEARGGIRVLQRIDCDEDYELPFSEFKSNVISYLSTEKSFVNTLLGLSAPSEATTSNVASTDAAPVEKGTRDNPHLGRLKLKTKLSKADSAKETMHYELDISGSGISYEAGDCIGVYPQNNPNEIRELLGYFDLSGDEPVVWKDQSFTLKDLLQNKICLQRISVDLMNLLAEQPGPAQNAVQAGHSAMSDYMSGNHILDVAKAHKRSLDAQQFASTLKRIQPRLYSIASSPKRFPSEVHFTIETLRYNWNKRPTEGVASTWFADRLGSEEGTIPLYLHSNPKFRLPDDNRPIIMIGPGTGIAPFRAFLQDKEAGGFRGKTWLFFGHQHEKCDFLYEEDLRNYLNTGILNRLDLAWSRDQESKVYVQNKMWSHKNELWNWIEQGANIYVCGDAQNMAEAVDQTLRLIARSFGMESDSWIRGLEQDMRYQRDVY